MKINIIVILIVIPFISLSQNIEPVINLQDNMNYDNNGKPYDGTYEEFYHNGLKKTATLFAIGVIKWTKAWNKKGTLIDSTIFLDGYNEFEARIFNKKGEIIRFESYYLKKDENDTIIGYYIKRIVLYYTNGNKKKDVVYINDMTKYREKLYYSNGNMKSIALVNVEHYGDSKLFHIQKDSVFTEYYSNGKIKRETIYHKGKIMDQYYY